MGTARQPAIADALKQLWDKFLPQMEERIAALEQANRSLAAASLTSSQREAAAAAAHKLAGVLGTFGLNDGTTLAREAEELYSGLSSLSPENLVRLESIVTQLHAMIRDRK